MPRLDFVPARDGFHFDNSFANRVLPGTPFTFTTHGLCGGMVMAALDHWRSGVPVPTHTEDQFLPVVAPDGGPVPGEGTRLRAYIYSRLVDSLLTKAMFSRWITFPWIGPQQFHDWAVGSEFDLVKGIIDSGRPAMLGLWALGGDPTTGHQILAYGYDEGPRRLYVYDPNHHDEESVLLPISPEAGVESRGTRSGSAQRYRGYFWTDVYNWDEQPPYQPRYVDLVVTDGLHVDAGEGHVGDPVQVTATVANVGEYPANFRELRVWSRGPDGAVLDSVLGGPEPGLTRLDPGQDVTLIRKAGAFGTAPGTHRVGVSYVSELGYERQLPARPGALAAADIELHRPLQLTVDRWVTVPEGARTPVDTGVDVRPGDELALSGEGSIWAGVWFTGENGPQGWETWVESKLTSPMHNTPDAHPFALIGRLGGDPWFLVGRGLPRRPVDGTQPRRLQLWINDDTPGNGSGQFRCHVQVWR